MRMFLVPLLAGCSLKTVLPGTAVMNAHEVTQHEAIKPSGVAYTGEPRTPFPIFALQPFGLQYAVDVVIVSDHSDWSMHEYARLDTPQGSFWIAKDSDPSGRQTIVADIPNLTSWLPEIPAPRFERPVSVDDRSSGDDIDVCLKYDNPKGQIVRACASGTMPKRPPPKRNGNTMGHSRDVVAAVLDIDRFRLFNTKGSIQIDEENTRVDRVLGLVPFRSLLRQTQAGLATANFRISGDEQGFTLTRPSPLRPEWPTHGSETWDFTSSTATYDNGIVAFSHHFSNRELTKMTVQQHGVPNQTFELVIHPALPDLSRPFSGLAQSTFVMNVNGQRGHGTGVITAQWTADNTVTVSMRPTAPSWLTDRPMVSTVQYNDNGSVDVFVDRVPVD